MIRLVWVCTVLFLLACDNSAVLDVTASEPAILETEQVGFEAVLKQYQDLNRRLENVAYRLQSSNVEICPLTQQSTGFTVHTVSDYPDNLQPYARALLQVDEGLSIRTVRTGSPAEGAGIKPGQRLVKIGTSYLPSGPTAQTMYEALTQRAFQGEQLHITLRSPDDLLTVSIEPETICGYPVILVFSEIINGHTNGRDVFITSELMRNFNEDDDLALVVAHEMAHAIAGDIDQPQTKDLELLADRMALIMLARAGFNIDKVIDNWARAPHPDSRTPSETHPTHAERLAQFKETQQAIKAGGALDFTAK